MIVFGVKNYFRTKSYAMKKYLIDRGHEYLGEVVDFFSKMTLFKFKVTDELVKDVNEFYKSHGQQKECYRQYTAKQSKRKNQWQ